jgi:hypothetical protein
MDGGMKMGNEYIGERTPALEVSVNLDENYQVGEGQLGRITKLLDAGQQERYLNGKFRNLIKYVMSDESGFSEDQGRTCGAIREKVKNESATSRVMVRLYDENDQEMEDEFDASGEIYLDDIVKDKTGQDPGIIRMGITTWSSVGADE